MVVVFGGIFKHLLVLSSRFRYSGAAMLDVAVGEMLGLNMLPDFEVGW